MRQILCIQILRSSEKYQLVSLHTGKRSHPVCGDSQCSVPLRIHPDPEPESYVQFDFRLPLFLKTTGVFGKLSKETIFYRYAGSGILAVPGCDFAALRHFNALY